MADHPVGRQADVLLELTSSGLCVGSEDAVHPTGVESEPAEPPLEFFYVVAAHHRGAVVKKPVAQPHFCFHQRVPGVRSADAVHHEPAVSLEVPQSSLSRRAELAVVSLGAVADESQPTLKIEHSFTMIAAP